MTADTYRFMLLNGGGKIPVIIVKIFSRIFGN